MSVPEIVHGQWVAKKKLRRAKELRSGMTFEEKMIWERLRNGQLNGLHFRRQQVTDGYIVDFYCHTANLIVEIDGEIHNSQQEADLYRDHVLSEKGLQVVHFRNEEVKVDIDIVLGKILSLALPPPSLPKGPL
jgi:very-short-patch-repair endonuclease